jgi:membrane protease YdiL (CAAX protease family)
MASDSTPNISSTPPDEPTPTAPVSSGPKWVFFGPKGLRAGWRILIFITLVVALSAGLFRIKPLERFIQSLGVRGTMTPLATIAGEVLTVVAVIVAAAIMTIIEKRSFADYGLPMNQAFGKRFWQGLPLGFAMLSLLLAVIWALRGFSLAGLAVSGAAAAKFGLLWAIAFFLTGVFEEFTFRGYLQATLGDGIGFWPAALILGVVFGALHLGNPGEAVFGGVMAGLFGLVTAFALRRTGNLWLPIAMHAAWDWGETYFYGVPDSGLTATGHLFNASFHGATWLTGGSVGPEGSWLVFPVLLIWALAIHLMFPVRRAATWSPRA